MDIVKTKKRYTYMPPVRMEKEELEEIKNKAKEMGYNCSQFVRYCIAKELEK